MRWALRLSLHGRIYTRCRCSWLVREDGSITQMTDDQRTTLITGVIDAMSTQGLRTIAVAFRDFVSGLHHSHAPCIYRKKLFLFPAALFTVPSPFRIQFSWLTFLSHFHGIPSPLDCSFHRKSHSHDYRHVCKLYASTGFGEIVDLRPVVVSQSQITLNGVASKRRRYVEV